MEKCCSNYNHLNLFDGTELRLGKWAKDLRQEARLLWENGQEYSIAMNSAEPDPTFESVA